MRKNLFFLLFILNAFVCVSQIKVGIMGGPQSAAVTETNSIAHWDTATGQYYGNRSGFHIGFMAEIPISQKSHFYFEPSILYSQKGRTFIKALHSQVSDTNYLNYTSKSLNVQYIDIPLNLAYKLPLSKKKNANFILSAGPYFSFFYNGTQSGNTINGFSSTDTSIYSTTNTSQNLQVGKKEDSYRTLGYGLNARAGFEIGKVTISGFYSQGLDNFYYASYNSTFKHKVYGASLGIWLGSIKEPIIISDKDKDGIPDDSDACPLQPGTALTHGCPDTDGDGIGDNIDKCPTVPGLAKYNGCPIPDTDGDGVNDEIDKCPTVAGLQKYNGCPIPDTDGDSINDEEDKCPTIAGIAKYNGCPIPDSDGDGINDEEDKCPNQPGVKENNGCPLIKEEITKQVKFAAENIFFTPNSADLLSRSFQSLDTVVAILQSNPELKLSVNGYTDNTGNPSLNQRISEKRAAAVKNYLVSKGIAENRLSARGYGQENPIADNNTIAGRAKNRRVELSLKN